MENLLAAPSSTNEPFCSVPVSIVIPCYQQGHFLGEAVRSALSQTYPKTEVVVVNDGSTDTTASVAASFAGAITYVKQGNRGLSRARNAGIEASSGEYLLFLDADDMLHPNAVDNLMTCTARRAIRIMGFQAFGDENDPLCQSAKILSRDFGNRDLILGNPGPPHCFCVPRDNVVALGGFDALLRGVADYDMWLRLVLSGVDVVPVPFVGAKYRRYPGQMSRDDVHMETELAEVRRRTLKALAQRADAWEQLGIAKRAFLRLVASDCFNAGFACAEHGRFAQAVSHYFMTAWHGDPISAGKGLLGALRRAVFRSTRRG